MTTDTPLQHTALYDVHLSLGARMAPFAGWLMPIQYQGILKEHEACRTQAVLFDTGHMGEFLVLGSRAAAAIGTKVRIQTARQELTGIVSATPFYKNGTARKPMAAFL